MRREPFGSESPAPSLMETLDRRSPSSALRCAAPLLAVLLGAWACSRPSPAGESMTSYRARESPAQKAELFSVPPEQLSHLQVVEVRRTNLPRVLRLPGSVTYNSFETTPVITQVSGPVTRIVAYPGQVVHTGQPMLYVHSPDYAQARASYMKSRDALALAEKNYARAQDLYAHRAVAEADLLQSESARNQARADFQAAEQALRVLGIAKPDDVVDHQTTAEIPVLAPIGGEVVERLVGPGQVVQGNTTQVFTLSNLRTVWVLANVYEHDLAYVHIGDPVTIQTDAYPTEFHGKVSYIAPALNADSRTLQVRIVTSNPGEKLKKDMYVTVVVRAGATQALTVPDSAVLRNAENQPLVYVAVAENQFAQRLVSIGESVSGRTEILHGLEPGERVVADGSLFLQFANSLQR